MRLAQLAGPVAGAQHDVPGHRHDDAVRVDLQVARRHLLQVAYRAAEHVHDRDVALDHGGFRIVVGRGLDPGEELGDRAEHHVGLAEGRQDLADVAEEGGVRPDDEHAAALERAPVSVEQVRGPVQRRDGLARARAALHDQHALQRGADDPVLLGLDGRHHVAHPAGAAAGDARDQHGLAGQAPAVRLGQPVQVEDLVVDPGDRAVPGVDVAAADQPVRVAGGGGVEGVGRGGAPVDEPRLVLVIPQADPADVQGAGMLGFRCSVGAAEAQAMLHGVQLGQPPRLFGRGDVAFDPGLEGASGAAAALRLGERALGPVPCLVKQAVKHIEIRLFLADGRGRRGIGLTKRHLYWYTFRDSILGALAYRYRIHKLIIAPSPPGSPG